MPELLEKIYVFFCGSGFIFKKASIQSFHDAEEKSNFFDRFFH